MYICLQKFCAASANPADIFHFLYSYFQFIIYFKQKKNTLNVFPCNLHQENYAVYSIIIKKNFIIYIKQWTNNIPRPKQKQNTTYTHTQTNSTNKHIYSMGRVKFSLILPPQQHLKNLFLSAPPPKKKTLPFS